MSDVQYIEFLVCVIYGVAAEAYTPCYISEIEAFVVTFLS